MSIWVSLYRIDLARFERLVADPENEWEAVTEGAPAYKVQEFWREYMIIASGGEVPDDSPLGRAVMGNGSWGDEPYAWLDPAEVKETALALLSLSADTMRENDEREFGESSEYRIERVRALAAFYKQASAAGEAIAFTIL